MKKFYNHEFYTAIMDEDLGHLEDLTKKHGSNFLIPVQDTAHGDLWKVKKKVSLPLKNVTWSEKMPTFLLKEDYDCGIFLIKKSEKNGLGVVVSATLPVF